MKINTFKLLRYIYNLGYLYIIIVKRQLCFYTYMLNNK